MLIDFIERGWEGEKHQLVSSLNVLHPGTKPAVLHVLWRGLEPVTSWFPG